MSSTLLEGKSDELINDFYREMDRYSKKNYERAAVYRDRISALKIFKGHRVLQASTIQRCNLCKMHKRQNKIGVTSVMKAG